MKKMSRKPFRGGQLFSSKANSSTASHGSSNISPGMSHTGANGVTRRSTWADKIREKLPPLGENEYEVLWERGVLGVIFLESEKDGIPYVSKATESCISSAVSQGDILTYVNVVRSKDHSFSDFFKILATMKKPVLLRFERLLVNTPLSDEDEASQLFGAQRSGAGNSINVATQFARQMVPNADEAEPVGRLRRAESMQKPPNPAQATRGAFWRTTASKEVGNSEKLAQTVGATDMNGTKDRMAVSQPQRHGSSTKDHGSPQDLATRNGNGGNSPLNPHEYQVFWETGSLGLFFAENRLTNMPVVTRSTTSANPIVRRTVAVNDTLISANGIKSADCSFEVFFGRLQQMSKPVRLVLRRKQPNEQIVIVKQAEPQQQQRQHQPQQQLQQRQQKPSEQQEGHQQDKKRESLKMREQQQRGQQKLRDQQHQEQQQREQQQREQQREQQQREQREQHQREQHQREQYQREQNQREQQLREQQLREQQQHEQIQRELQQREQRQQREQKQRELQQREQRQREQQQHEKESRDQQQLEDKQYQQNFLVQKVASTVSADLNSPPLASPAHGQPHHDRNPSPTVKRASTPPARPPSPRNRRESTANYRDSRHAGKANMQTSPTSPFSRKSSLAKRKSSSNRDISPQINLSPMFQSSPNVDDSPNGGSSPTMTGSPLTSPASPSITTHLASEVCDTASSPDVRDEENHFLGEEEDCDIIPKESGLIAEKSYGRRSRNSIEEGRNNRTGTSLMHDGEPVLSPAGKTTHLSTTELWELPEKISSSPVMAEPIEADEDECINIGNSVPSSTESHVNVIDMAGQADIAVEAGTCGAETAEESKVVEEVTPAEVSEPVEEIELAEEAEVAEDDLLDEETDFSKEEEPAIPLHSVATSTESDVEVGMLADEELDIAIEENEGGVEAIDGWDFEQGSERENDHHHGSVNATLRDENSTSQFGRSSVDGAARSESAKVDFADAAESADDFTNDQDISSDFDIVDGDIMMQQASKDRVEANQPRPAKSSLYANLAKYKKKGKTSRGVVKLPALNEEQAQTVPLLAPNAVNTTVQVRGRPKPKSTMSDTPDSTTYLVKWKENRSIGLQLKEVRLAKGTYPLIMDVCHEPCCELLRHICVGDVILEINGRNTSTMGVKKTVNFLKTCTKTTLMKIRHGPGFVIQRVSATV